MHPEAPTLPCARCGVGLRVDPEAPEARCRHCGATTPIAGDVRERARAHRVAVLAELRRLSWSETLSRGIATGAAERLSSIYFHAICGLAAVLTLGQLAPSFGAAPEIAHLSIGVFVVGLGLSMGLFFLALKGAIRKDMLEGDEPPPRTPADLAAARVTGRCGTCGGAAVFALSEPMGRCSHCGTSVLPTDAVRAELTALAAFRADIAQGRASRDWARSHAAGAVSRGLDGVFWAIRRLPLFIPLLVAYAIAQALAGAAPPPKKGRRPPADEWLVPLPVLVMAGGAGLTLVLLAGSALLGRRSARASPRRLALDALARRYGARVRADGLRAAVEWLDVQWAATSPDGSMEVGNSDDGTPITRLAVSLHHRGAPVLLVLADAPHVRRLDVFVSGYAPGRAERAHYPAAQDLRAAGFAVALGRPGVHLLYPSSDPRFCEPDAAVWMLERAVHLLHESARPGPQS